MTILFIIYSLGYHKNIIHTYCTNLRECIPLPFCRLFVQPYKKHEITFVKYKTKYTTRRALMYTCNNSENIE